VVTVGVWKARPRPQRWGVIRAQHRLEAPPAKAFSRCAFGDGCARAEVDGLATRRWSPKSFSSSVDDDLGGVAATTACRTIPRGMCGGQAQRGPVFGTWSYASAAGRVSSGACGWGFRRLVDRWPRTLQKKRGESVARGANGLGAGASGAGGRRPPCDSEGQVHQCCACRPLWAAVTRTSAAPAVLMGWRERTTPPLHAATGTISDLGHSNAGRPRSPKTVV